jgi:membrane-associated phospholipid phosphatase
MQLKILNFFGNFSSPFLDRVVQFITMFGEESLFIVVIVFLLWCFSKRKGFTLFSTLFSALLAMGIIKAVVRYPRPFQVHPEIGAQRLSTATGYSFPSGHSTGAASFYGSVALAFKKQYLSIISALLIVLVALSRLYLKVHWPLDVFGGVTLGLVASFVQRGRRPTLVWCVGCKFQSKSRLWYFYYHLRQIELVGYLQLLVVGYCSQLKLIRVLLHHL